MSPSTPARSSNPRPRSALNKAVDAKVHPAAPAGVMPVPRVAKPAPAATPAAPGAAPAPAPRRRKSKFGGSTSDTMRTPPAAGPEPLDLLSGATGSLEVQIPKKLRKAIRKEAERRELRVDQVVTDLLVEWLRR